MSPVIVLHEGWYPGPKSERALSPAFDQCAYAPTEPCSDYIVQYPLYSSAAIWVMVGHGDPSTGISGASFTIDFDGAWSAGVDVYGWTLCADSETPSVAWPEPGSGNVIRWDPEVNCQRTEIGAEGVHAAAGLFYIYAYSDDVFRIPTPQEGAPVPFSVTDCDGNEIIPDQAAPAAAFGNAQGYNPCAEEVPVLGTTWGRLKTQY